MKTNVLQLTPPEKVKLEDGNVYQDTEGNLYIYTSDSVFVNLESGEVYEEDTITVEGNILSDITNQVELVCRTS